MENGGNVSKAMREAGYAPSVAANPEKLTKSKAWEELLEQYFPDALVLDKGFEGLDATRASNAAILITQDGTVVKAEEQGLIEVPDYLTRHKYLETVLKLKKRLGPETQTVNNIAANDMKIEFIQGDK